jgi:ABC-type spermidine/putrescine transport system permease subunit I
MNLPFMILAVFNVLDGIPKNLILASYDLGQN